MENFTETHTRFYDLEQLQFTEDEFSAKEIEYMEELTGKALQASDLDELMTIIFELSQDVFPCDRLSLAFVRDAGRRMVTTWSRANYQPTLIEKGYSTELHKTSLAELLARGGARITDNLEEFIKDHPNSETTQLLLEEGARSSMAIPIIVDQRGVGLFFRTSRKYNAYDEHLLKLQMASFKRMGLAIEKAYRMDQLREANSAYMEILGFVAHELKSPLASIILDARIIKDGHLGETNKEQEKKLDNIITRSTYLMDLVKDYLDLARIEGGNFKINLLNDVDFLNDVVRPCIDLVNPQVISKNMIVDIEEPGELLLIQCDPDLMRIAVLNLLDNAVKYGQENGNIVVLLSRTNNGMVFSVWNEGHGFPEDQQDRLFKRFSRLNTKQLMKKKGTGLGLYTTWRIIDMHNGDIEARSEQGLWAEFIIRLPQPVRMD